MTVVCIKGTPIIEPIMKEKASTLHNKTENFGEFFTSDGLHIGRIDVELLENCHKF